MNVVDKADRGLLIFFCPGCKENHGVWTGDLNELTGARWSWNGSMEKPTFSPSIKVTGSRMTPKGEEQYEAYCRGEIDAPERLDSVDTCCHSFVREGMIEFLSDCTHELAGKTVPLQPTE